LVFKDDSSLIKEIKSGNISPVYLLHGEESFYIDRLTNYIETHLLPEAEKSFNQQVIYGKDLTLDTVVDYARQFPMMGQYRVLIVKEAQELRMKDEKGDENLKFESFLNDPPSTTVLILAHKNKKADGRAKWAKIIKEKHVILESNPIRDFAVRAWIEKYIKSKNLIIKVNAAELVAEYLGTNLSKVANELDKLIVNLEGITEIGLEEVEKNIGISKDYNVFELQDALITKNYEKTYRIVSNFQGNMKRQPMEMILGSLFSFYQRLYIVYQNISQGDAFLTKMAGINPYFLKKTKEQSKSLSERGYGHIFKILKDYDARTKGYKNRSTSREELLKEMVGKLLIVS